MVQGLSDKKNQGRNRQGIEKVWDASNLHICLILDLVIVLWALQPTVVIRLPSLMSKVGPWNPILESDRQVDTTSAFFLKITRKWANERKDAQFSIKSAKLAKLTSLTNKNPAFANGPCPTRSTAGTCILTGDCEAFSGIFDEIVWSDNANLRSIG